MESKIETKIENGVVENWEDLYQKAKTIENLDEKLLIYCYLFIPLRSDISSIKIRDFNKQIDNYYDSNNKQIVFNSLVKKQKILSVDIPVELNELIETFIKRNPNEIYLIKLTHSNRNLNITKRLAVVSEKYFGKGLTINDYRHIYSTFQADKVKHLPIRKQVKAIDDVSKLMNNSVKTQIQYYICKLMDDKHDKFKKELNDVNVIHSYDGKIYIVDKIVEVIDTDLLK